MLGQKHLAYEADPFFMDHMGLMFITAIKPILTKEVKLTKRVIDMDNSMGPHGGYRITVQGDDPNTNVTLNDKQVWSISMVEGNKQKC